MSVTRSLTAFGYLRRWMDRQGLEAKQLNDDVLEAFLPKHVNDRGRRPRRGMMPLLTTCGTKAWSGPSPRDGARRLTRSLVKYRDW